jgi:hypothetical protein
MSPAAVAAILAAGDLALMALEIPTGWFADRFGHRRSLALGSLIQTMAMIWCWLGEGMPGLVMASLLVGLGDAFRSGADEALLYRTCAALDRKDDFQRINARTGAIELVALVGLVLLGGVIVQSLGFAAGWIAETALCAVGFGLACAMVEPPAAMGADEAGASSNATATPNQWGRPSPPAIPWRTLALVIVPAALIDAAAGVSSFLAQTTGAADVEGMTVLVATITLAEAAGSWAAARMFVSQTTLASVAALIAATAVAFPSTFQAAAVALSFLAGLAIPLRATAIQRMAGDHVRARLASLASAGDMALSTLTLPLAGWWRAR